MCSDNRIESWRARDCGSPRPRSVTADETPTVQLSVHRPPLANSSFVTLAPISGSTLRSRYVLEDVIGQAGTSIVFRAKDLLHDRAVALKLLRTECRADPSALRRLQHEFLQMRSLSHPSIVQVFEFDCDGDTWFITMELIAGMTVKSWMVTPRSYADALKLVTGCCSALEHAHSAGVLHGDLKPTNVMVAPDGTAKLIDFGSASSLNAVIADGALTLTATPCYASPQILAGTGAEQRDDIYSLACLSYSILSGGLHPFGGRPSFENGRAKRAPAQVLAIPREVFRVIERSLSVEREGRAASAGEFLRDLLDAERRRHAVTAPSVGITDNRGSGAGSQRKAAAGATRRVTGRAARRRFSLANTMAVALAIVGLVWLQLDRQRVLINAAVPPKQLPEPSVRNSAPQLQAAVAGQPIALSEVRFPAPAEVISFDAPTTVHVGAGQSLLAINVRRQPAGGPVSFVWRLKSVVGFPGLDRRQLAPQRVTFNDGQTVRTIFIPLIDDSDGDVSRGSGSFSVVLQRVAGGPALGRVTRVNVIAAPSTNALPVLYQQTSPDAGADTGINAAGQALRYHD